MIKIILYILSFLFCSFVLSNEIVKDKKGNYFLVKEDGTYQKLPPPKPGNKYVIKKKIVKKKVKNLKIFQKPIKKSRIRTNQGFK